MYVYAHTNYARACIHAHATTSAPAVLVASPETSCKSQAPAIYEYAQKLSC